ncbi:MAG: SMC-Scp complex subunit ScpB [Desulfobacterales bacterium]|nr:SMC-Scp complex subunit ScpB [Desulfobacterales bacterium]
MAPIKPIIEGLLFISGEPLNAEQIKKVIPDAGKEEIEAVLADIKEEFEKRNGGFVLHEVAGGFQFRTKPEHREYIHRLFQPSPTRLSKAALETLAIIAYRQPVMRSEIEHVRGVNSGNTIRLLMERKLVRILGRREIPGRPIVYATTQKFLEAFDLKDLKDLPTPKDIDERQPPSKPDDQPLPLRSDLNGPSGPENNT